MCWQNIIKYISLIVLFIVIDAPYLYLNSSLYSKIVKNITKGGSITKRYYSGLIVYLALALGIMVLVLPNIRTNSIANMVKDSLYYGGIFGLVTYATFDFTTHFMLEGWDLGVSVMDTVWGAILCTLVTLIFSYLKN